MFALQLTKQSKVLEWHQVLKFVAFLLLFFNFCVKVFQIKFLVLSVNSVLVVKVLVLWYCLDRSKHFIHTDLFTSCLYVFNNETSGIHSTAH